MVRYYYYAVIGEHLIVCDNEIQIHLTSLKITLDYLQSLKVVSSLSCVNQLSFFTHCFQFAVSNNVIGDRKYRIGRYLFQ